MKTFLKDTARFAARQTIGRFPRPASRLNGKLAVDGGAPVRNLRFRPWRKNYNNTLAAWRSGVGATFRDVFRSGVEGLPQPLATKFAEKWSAFVGARHALLLPHGTDALRIALAAVFNHDGLDYGGELIVPNLSFIASATSALDRRFGVVFVDVDPGTLLLDPQSVEAAITPGRTRAIMPVHLFGQPCDMTALGGIARRHGLKIVEDAAQAHGAVWEGGCVGSLGDAAGFSFQSHKNLNSGEGGMLTTNDDEIFERAYSLHNVGRERINGGRWEHVNLGWNCRPTEYQAALLLERFRTFEAMQERRRTNFFLLRELLADVPCLRAQAIPHGVKCHGVHMLVMRYQSEECGGLGVEDFLRACGAEGVPMYRGYECTLSNQPALKKLIAKRPEYFRLMPTPMADLVVRELVYISQEILLGTKDEMVEIAAAIRKVAAHYTRCATAGRRN